MQFTAKMIVCMVMCALRKLRFKEQAFLKAVFSWLDNVFFTRLKGLKHQEKIKEEKYHLKSPLTF